MLILVGDFLIVITNRQHHGQLLGHDIYRATDFKVLPISSGSTATNLLNHPVEKHLLSLVHSHLNSSFFWFSYTWDLTRRLQAQWVAQEETKGLGMWESVDQRFFWNSHLHTKLVDASQANPDQDVREVMIVLGCVLTGPLAQPIHPPYPLWQYVPSSRCCSPS